MTTSLNPIDVYLEIGKKRVFAGALDWPGWCRSGKNEGFALQALFENAPRYARVASLARLAFAPPVRLEQFRVVERLPGNTTTDFGAPDCAPDYDALAVNDQELESFSRLLRACWDVLDETAARAAGKTLRLGPRGGGRDVAGILQHVLGAEWSYRGMLGSKAKMDGTASLEQQFRQERQAVLAALADTAHGKVEARGPRGGQRWSPRYAVRRIAWHVLDHAWEIEDRVLP
jgi:hypothetical protein